MHKNAEPEKKELLFSVTAADCDWYYFTSGGPGGQRQNKVATACRCRHKLSGAEGVAREHSMQHQNKKAAFGRMAESPKFKAWLKVETGKYLLSSEQKKEAARRQQAIEDAVDRSCTPENLRIEMQKAGEWVPYVDPEEIEPTIQCYAPEEP